MLPGGSRRERRFERHARRRQPLVVAAGAVAQQTVDVAVPVHRRDPAVTTLVAAVEIASFVALVLTASAVAGVVLGASLLAFLALTFTDRRAVVALGPEGRGALLDAGRDGRPTRLIGPAVVDELPIDPTGLSTPIMVNGERWHVDRSAYRNLASRR